MLVLYDKKDIKTLDKEFVWDVEDYFLAYAEDLLKMDKTFYIVEKIDGAKHIKNDVFDGKFGTCAFKDLSTGCKAVLLSYFFKESKVVSFAECGNNAYNCASELDCECHIYFNRRFNLNDLDTKVVYKGKLVNILDI